MRAAVIREFSAPLSLETVPDPVCEADGVVLKLLACGICRSDWHGWTGEHPKVRPGDIPGHEYCGEVVEAGPLAQWKPGDRLIAPFILACGSCPDCRSGQSTICQNQRVPGFGMPGAYAGYISAPHAHNLTRLPDSLSPALAAGLGCRITTRLHSAAPQVLRMLIFPPYLAGVCHNCGLAIARPDYFNSIAEQRGFWNRDIF